MPKKPKKPRADAEVVGYIRKSDVDYRGASTAEEREAIDRELTANRMGICQDLARKDGRTITRWYVDLDISGREGFIGKRSQLTAMVAAADAGTISHIYAVSIARIVRDVEFGWNFIRRFQKAGVVLVAPDLGDLDSAAGRLQASIMMGVHQFDAEVTGERIRANNEQLVTSGAWGVVQGRQLGFHCTRRAKGDPERPPIKVDEETAPIVRAAFQAFLDTHGVAHRASQMLNKASLEPAGIPLAHGRYWTAGSLLRLITRPAYRRIARYGRVSRYSPELIPEVVDPGVVAAVDALIIARHTDARGAHMQKPGHIGTTYHAFVTCGHCGGSIKFNGSDAIKSPSWKCYAATLHRPACPDSVGFLQKRFEVVLFRALATVAREGLRAYGPDGIEGTKARKVVKPTGQAERLARLTVEQERWRKMYAAGALGDDIARLTAELQRIDQAIAAVPDDPAPDAAPAAPPRSAYAGLLASIEEIASHHLGQRFSAPIHTLLRETGIRVAVKCGQQDFIRRREPRKTARRTGGLIGLQIEIAALGLTGDRAIMAEETMEEWRAGTIGIKHGRLLGTKLRAS